ncbi:hypothetical protein P886_1974 [Alteromonadaceae bacterium 2753L.S.0a.02]|nr:hypothetical protein P886_1974 [Alteromonadaceae bacterium 2753L.S.0a.02]
MNVEYFEGSVVENGILIEDKCIQAYFFKGSLKLTFGEGKTTQSPRRVSIDGDVFEDIYNNLGVTQECDGLYVIGPENDPRDGEFREYIFYSAKVHARRSDDILNVTFSGETLAGSHVFLYGGRTERFDFFPSIKFAIDINVIKA